MTPEQDSTLDLSPYGLDPEEMKGWVSSEGQPRFRAQQLCNWLYRKHAASFREMLNLPADWRAELEERV